ncbi:MAG: type I-MYXAN CRISPR-associated protein Cas6/Cmx6, partial [Pseudomonadota bacterium]
MQSDPKVELSFQVFGKSIPVDHGFALHGAVSDVLPYFHEDQAVGLKLLRGRYIGDGMLDISPHSELILRLAVGRLPLYIRLAGKRLQVLGQNLTIGVPTTRALIPAVALYSHLVTTRNGEEQERFEKEIAKQMNSLHIRGRFSVGERKTFRVHGKQVVGYTLLVSELNAEESIRLQENGLGGRRKMGCGFFEP